ncbi:MAG TPA: MBL fold metallo-hydrolase [Desulfobacterales bacterium]
MFIKCWGSRGSIPVSGRSYLKYGGDTTCLEIRSHSGDIVIVDAGTGIRRLGNRLLDQEHRTLHFLFTHAHWDHVMGFPYFKPLYYPHTKMYMHRCPFQKRFVETILSKVMAPPYFPVKYSDIRASLDYEDACPTAFDIGSIHVEPIPLSHPNNGSGYKFSEDGKTFVFLTDNELGYLHPGGRSRQDYTDFCRNADLLFHDAEYTPEEYRTFIDWGHSVYTDTLAMALDAGVARLGLFHLNQDRTDTAMDAIVRDCRRRIQKGRHSMECFAVGADMAFEL